MSDTVIKVENLSKSYTIRHQNGERYTALRDVLANGAKNIGGRLLGRDNGTRNTPPSTEEFWALNDVSFEVKQGERVGIIGRNGAGKSTLLKILSRITEPTKGRIHINGRVASLLEVGTGFHPELTGRENIYLNGAILGMSREEIRRKFDEIVAFAEVEKFLDTPVKRYSSGMYVRLAFAVAAHLEPDIMMVDEVLAVGDTEFQKKCLGKMNEISSADRTIFFVSHQMNQIRRLCDRCIWFDNGRIHMEGRTRDVISMYESSSIAEATINQLNYKQNTHYTGWQLIKSEDGKDKPYAIQSHGPVKVKFLLNVDKPIKGGMHGIALYDANQTLLWGTTVYNVSFETGLQEIIFSLESLPLRPGVYQWLVSIFDGAKLIESCYCIPNLHINTIPLSGAVDQWAGLLNVAWGVKYNSTSNE